MLCETGPTSAGPRSDRQRFVGRDELVEREDSRLPLLEVNGSPAPTARLHAAYGPEHERIADEAVQLLSRELTELRSGKRVLNRGETSELLRDVCQSLADLTIGLEGEWYNSHPGEPLPKWPVSCIPEEELARIGWDFHANRVQMIRNTGGSIWESIAFLLKGDEQASFAKPPSAGAVAEALQRAATRLQAPANAGLRPLSPRSTVQSDSSPNQARQDPKEAIVEERQMSAFSVEEA
mmetsp:Transcript_2/g.5  ORF Transcript_2/g.5 Transcript_2/m.5 type:complete len:237 (-) Transcript_2:524-1234(-)|eukprot:CAMPEP_0194748654 /NCGR_PEP_ID=MMETSP0323_2-20130528/2800_1 /TAXON_ID=2866 ORGANISM="Crypthecodinium cohnii, Strain Seligo" /NCGR_SAMPLE_ID=MMETSP0323_2 /ASSEMBLY_ACC=CAM_ASM_000346 /LENGTH=236 /DNA_ID=CAMNT_0039663077 /DNA_START=13 /DNA_END=723 /DNA_ORIENTATION=-